MSEEENIGTYSKAALEATIADHVRANGRIIYWHHHLQVFMFLKAKDKKQYKVLMKEVKDWLADGTVTRVTAGAPLVIDGTELYPMEVEFRDLTCGPYFLLTERGMFEDTDKTPYFFRTAEKRENAINYIITRQEDKK